MGKEGGDHLLLQGGKEKMRTVYYPCKIEEKPQRYHGQPRRGRRRKEGRSPFNFLCKRRGGGTDRGAFWSLGRGQEVSLSFCEMKRREGKKGKSTVRPIFF